MAVADTAEDGHRVEAEIVRSGGEALFTRLDVSREDD